jgi:hypothetical protein
MTPHDLDTALLIAARLEHNARDVEQCGHLNAARWMRLGADAIAYLLDALAEATCEGCATREPDNVVSDEWADDLAAAVIEQERQ